ncbi:molecular chaperone DnaK, partial [Candidatus Sumerlaeota bacterium]|nr:molecular chaperone DnaK [Candidatus Sumerlaeota bacterium]
MAQIEHIIGIDLGTTNSVVAVVENGEPHIIPSTEGDAKTPSVVAFQPNGEILVGEIARRQAATQPHRTISSAKRLIGRYKSEIDEGGEVYPFQLTEDERGMVAVSVDGKSYSPEQVSALILQKLKAAAEEYLGSKVSKAVVTVPAYFDDIQRQATLHAAEIAGLEVLRLINEPTAAAMAYGLNRETQETVALYDFGGGTFDFSVLDIDNNAFEVLTSTGNSRLGGDDLDMALVDFVAERFAEKTGIDLRADTATLRRLKDEAERAKCELSTSNTAQIRLPFIAQVEGNPIHLEETIRRETVEELFEPYVHETLQWCRQGLKDANIKKGQVTKVILVGGSTRIPLVQELVEDFFGIAPFKGVNPDEVVAVGAATQAAVLAGELEEVILLDVTPHTLGIEIKGNRKSVIVQKNSTIPIKAYKTFTTTEDNQSFVNIHLLQGEEEKASECRSLGKFTLSGIPEAKAGAPRIRVEIFVNSDGVVEVSASESHSGQEQKLVTTCSYLNADERRAQHTSSLSRRKKRRRRPGGEVQDQRRQILRGAGVPDESLPGSDTGARHNLASSFTEIDSQARAAAMAEAATAAAPPPIAPSKIETTPASPPKPTPTAQQGAVTPAFAPPDETAPAIKPIVPSKIQQQAAALAADTSETSTSAADTAVRAAAPPPIVPLPGMPFTVPANLREVVNLLMADRTDEAAFGVYERDKDVFLAFCEPHQANKIVQAYKAKFLIFTKHPEEARDVLAAMRDQWPDARATHFDLYSLLCANFPNYAKARRERAFLANALGNYQTAMADLEFIIKRGDESAPVVFDDLAKVYEKVISESNDATIQFKLVKLHLRKGELDEAIALLQQLVQMSEHRNRANKVMGFCFWQKGLRYLAWQKFKLVPLDDEMMDNLYRLAEDMESNDELVHAQHVLERIYGADINYRDCADRLKKINYRIELMQDERYGAPDSPPEDGGGDGGGKVIADRFELIEEINRGSMGIVYKARDRILDEIVAIKVLNDFLCADPASVKRFKSECKSARRLTHANVVAANLTTMACLGLTATDHYLLALPLFHITALGMA